MKFNEVVFLMILFLQVTGTCRVDGIILLCIFLNKRKEFKRCSQVFVRVYQWRVYELITSLLPFYVESSPFVGDWELEMLFNEQIEIYFETQYLIIGTLSCFFGNLFLYLSAFRTIERFCTSKNVL